MSLKKYDVCVLGAGASGLMCAGQAALRGLRVAVLDHGPVAGRKVRVSGGGRCNLTNVRVGAEHFLSGNPHFCKSALAGLSPRELTGFFNDLDLGFAEEDNGKLFCAQGAAALARALEGFALRAGAEVLLSRRILEVERLDGERPPAPGGPGPRFRVRTPEEVLECRSLVVALGGPAWPSAGASGLGLDLARRMGLAVVETRPALVPLTMPRDWPFAELSGIALPVGISCGKARFLENLLFTHRGLSGPAALQISVHWAPGRQIAVDLLPGQDFSAILEALPDRRALVRTVLGRLFPQRLAQLLAGHALPPGLAERRVCEAPGRELRRAGEVLHAWTLAPSGTEGWAKAEVTAGGVDTRGLSSRTLEAKAVPGLHCIGEVVDVTGRLGGYNLHWAFASGLACGRAL